MRHHLPNMCHHLQSAKAILYLLQQLCISAETATEQKKSALFSRQSYSYDSGVYVISLQFKKIVIKTQLNIEIND